MASKNENDHKDDSMTLEEFGEEKFKALPEEPPPEDWNGVDGPTE